MLKRRPPQNDPRPIQALVEPLPGHTDDEVVACLEDQGARDVEILAAGFISATLDPATVPRVEQIAHVHAKPRSRPLRAP